MSNQPTLCIYHANCIDGFAAAWAVRYALGDQVEFHPGIYGEAAPDVSGRAVILVDFSYPRPELLQLAEQASSVLILDHHQTAEDYLQDLPPNVVTVFDMTRSGAMITWQAFFPDQPAPLLFEHIQDRDLWQFKLPQTREITTALFSYQYNFAAWDCLMNFDITTLIIEGRALLRKHDADIEALIANTGRQMFFGTIRVPVANVPWMYASDVAGALAEGYPFAATYYDDANGRRWSLRSSADGADVAKIAEAFGGGGHKHAAGFHMSHEEAIDFELSSGLASHDENDAAAATANFPHGSLGEEVAA